MTSGQEAPQEYSAYIKGDSLIVMAIDTTKVTYDLKLRLPYPVKSGVQIVSTGNETTNLRQEKAIAIDEPSTTVTVEMPGRSLNTYIFMIQREEDTGIEEQTLSPLPNNQRKGGVFSLAGQRVNSLQKGIYIIDGKKVIVR